MAATFTKIATVTVGSGGTLQIDFSSIPSSYTDLCLKVSSRDDRGADWTAVALKLNDATTSFTNRTLYGIGSGGGYSTNASNNTIFDGENAANTTSNVFSNWEIYIPNYAGSNYKSFSVDAVTENNATTSYAWLLAGLWSNTSAITKVSILLSSTIKFVQYTSATLYGIKNA